MKISDGAMGYVLGHSDEELVRLERQAEIFRDATEAILAKAGIVPGMRVLDIGCGVGDVSLIAARRVGPEGRVTGIDRSEEALVTARRRTEAAGIVWLDFDNRDIDAIGGDERYDAVIGRFILMHLPGAAEQLRKLRQVLAPGGVLAFIEMDISSSSAVPPMPLFTRCLGWITTLYRMAGMEPDMGSKLYGTFRAAGLTPELSGSCRIEGGPDATAYEYIAETIRTMSPMLQRFGLATAEELDVETLAARLRAAAVENDTCFVFPRFIGAWARN
jgi:ubiquinone/menaquinone biosynthesis C-methylase UbiE